jgi:hypothetical protein
VVFLALAAVAQVHTKPQVTQSPTETLWTGRFAHCDYGFYVLLPRGVVAHANQPPNPMHGFTVALPDVGTRQEVSTERERFIWVNAEYDMSDSTSVEHTIAYYARFAGLDELARTVVENRAAKLRTRPGAHIRVEYDSPSGKAVEEQVIAVRRNIVYTIGMRTNRHHYEQDRQELERVIAGFRESRIQYCN